MKDFSKYLIVSDLDGTFLADHSALVPRNLEAIGRFCACGGMFTFATGRTASTVLGAIPIAPTLLSAPAVLCNGTYLYDFATKTPYMEDLLPPDLIRELLDFLQAEFPTARLRACTRGQLYYDALEKNGLLHLKQYDPSTYTIEPDRTKWPLSACYKLIIVPRSSISPAQLRQRLSERFGDRFFYTSADAINLELQSPGISKAAGLEKLRRFSKSTMGRKLIACGDFENDVEMLRAADIAVCPANACDAAKAVADHVLCDHNDGVIADIIEALEAQRID